MTGSRRHQRGRPPIERRPAQRRPVDRLRRPRRPCRPPRTHAPRGAQVEVRRTKAAPPFVCKTDGPAYAAARQAMVTAYGKPPAEAGSGGSIRLLRTLQQAAPEAAFILWGAEDVAASRIHAADESVDPRRSRNSFISQAQLIQVLAESADRPERDDWLRSPQSSSPRARSSRRFRPTSSSTYGALQIGGNRPRGTERATRQPSARAADRLARAYERSESSRVSGSCVPVGSCPAGQDCPSGTLPRWPTARRISTNTE